MYQRSEPEAPMARRVTPNAPNAAALAASPANSRLVIVRDPLMSAYLSR